MIVKKSLNKKTTTVVNRNFIIQPTIDFGIT